jgi:dCTP deaminase
MGIKSDKWIRTMSKEFDMINPFHEKQVRQGIVSYGVSSYGYDIRVSDEFMIFTNVNTTIVDPKNFDKKNVVEVKGDCIIPPNSFALCRSCLLYTSPSPRDRQKSRMPSSA